MTSSGLNISVKGMILVAVPLVFELLFVGILAAQLHQSEEQTHKLTRSCEIVSENNKLTQTYLDAGNALVAWKVNHNTKFARSYAAELDQLGPIQGRLDKLAAGDQTRLAHIAALKAIGDRIVSLTQQSMRSEYSDYRHEIGSAFEHLMEESQLFNRDEMATQLANPDEGSHFRERLRILLIAGVIFNVVVTAALAYFFSKNITGRLKVVTENSKRLTERAELYPRVGGHDEISPLDESFHKMAGRLRHAELRKQEYVAMISHDLRTPLAAIQGTLAVATRGTYGELNEKGRQRLTAAEADAERLIGLITEMLEYDKLESGTFALERIVHSLSSLSETAIEIVRPLSEQKNISIDIKSGDLSVNCDREKIVRVLVNLLGNAIKFSEPGTSIKIEGSQNDDSSIIRIKDTGRGIPAADQARIFDRFAQVEKSDATRLGGSGLGLAICKAIVEAHGGLIGVDSKVGKGSTFWISLPKRAPVSNIVSPAERR